MEWNSHIRALVSQAQTGCVPFFLPCFHYFPHLSLIPMQPLPSLVGVPITVEGSDCTQEPICHKADSVSCLAAPPPNGIMAHSLHFARSTALNFVLVAQGALDMFWWVSSVLFFSVL